MRLWLWLPKEFLAYADSLVLPLILTKPDNCFFPCYYLSTEYVCPKLHVLVQFSSFAQSCPTLCNPMNHNTPGLPVHHQLPDCTQTHVHWVGDAIQPSHPVIPFFSCLQPFPASVSFQMSQLFASGGQSIGVLTSKSVLPMNTQDWMFRMDWDSQESSPTSQLKSINSSVLSFLYSPTLTSIHNHWKNHSLD